MQRVWVQFLVGELRSYKCSQKKKKRLSEIGLSLHPLYGGSSHVCGSLEDGSLSPRHLCWPFAICLDPVVLFSMASLYRHHLNSLTAQSAPSQGPVSHGYSAVHRSQQLKIGHISFLNGPVSIPSLNFFLLIFWTCMTASCDDSGSLFVLLYTKVPQFLLISYGDPA